MADDHKRDYVRITLDGYSGLLNEYLVPVMTIKEGETVNLRLLVYVRQSPKIILFAFDNPLVETYGHLSFRVKEQSIIDPEVCHPVDFPHTGYHIEITCHRPFDRAVHLKAYAIPRIAEAPDKIMAYKENGRILPEVIEGYPLVLPELCGMLRILPNDEAHWRKIKVVFFSVRTNVNEDPAFGIENEAVFSEKLGQLNKYLSQAYVKAEGAFEEIDLTRKKADWEAYRNACFRRATEDKYVVNYEKCFRSLLSLLRSKIPSRYNDSSRYIRIFFLPEECVQANSVNSPSIAGFSVKKANGDNLKLTFCFGGHEETTPVHELLHALGLPHTFDGISPRAKYTYEDGKTDNLMDYIHRVGVERKSLFEWQWETINQKINR